MKKIIASALAFLMLAFVGVTAFAATNDGKTPSSATVYGKYEAGAEAPETISVDIVWEDMKFTYREAAKEWNPETHEYDQPDGVWDETPRNIKVDNNSNINIMCIMICEWNDGILGGFDRSSNRERSEQRTVLSSPKNGDFNGITQPVFVSGGKLTTAGNIGTITVSVSTYE